MKTIHLIGAGGIGMTGLRAWLKDSSEYNFTCSDDAKMETGFIPENQPIPNTDFVVVSSAIRPEHPQYKFALQNNIPIIHRAEMTKKIADETGGKIISVTGAHGKGSTSALIAFTLNSEYRTSFLVGAVLQNFKTSAQYLADSDFCVLEADESDNSMNTLTGDYHFIVNIEEEHIDYYGTIKNYHTQMQKFSEASTLTIAHITCKKHLNRNDIIFYGNGTEFFATNIRMDSEGSKFDLNTPTGVWKDMYLQLKGNHMIENAVGATALLLQLGLSEDQIRKSFSNFSGTKKRMEEFKYRDRLIIQDYANHPNDISVVVDTIRKIHSSSRIYVVWEPHKFSRIDYKDNFERILSSFRGMEEIFLLPVYAAGESEATAKYSNKRIFEEISQTIRCSKVYSEHDIRTQINEKTKPGDVIICFGSAKIYDLVNKACGFC